MDIHERIMLVIFLTMIIAGFLLIHGGAQGSINIDVNEQYHQAVLEEILHLESSTGRNLHGKDGEWGVAQFKEESFEYLKRVAGMPWLSWKDNVDQVILLDWCLRNGYEYHWTTSRKAQENVVIRKYHPAKAK